MIRYLRIKNIILLFFNNKSFRLVLSLFFGMVINSFYVAVNLASAFLYKNVWSATLTVYHSIFLIIRFYLICANRKNLSDLDKRRVCFRVGIFLLFLDLAATLMMFYTVRLGKSTHYSGILLFGFLIYTVYSLIVSIVGLRRHLNDNRPLHFAAKNMTLAAALMSVFNLQYSILLSLGASSQAIERIIALGGFAVFIIIITLAVMLVVRNAPRGSKIWRISYTDYSEKARKPFRKTKKEK